MRILYCNKYKTPDPPEKVPLEKRASLAVSCPATLSFQSCIDDRLPVHKVDSTLPDQLFQLGLIDVLQI